MWVCIYNSSMNEHKIIYIVYEECIEWGTTIHAAYFDEHKVQEHANQSSSFYYEHVILQ